MRRAVKKSRVKIISVFVFTALTLVIAPALAVDTGLNYATALGLGTTDIRQTILTIVQVALAFLGVLAILIVLYGGFVWMTAGGEENKIQRAKDILRNGIIGLVIILTSYAIVTFVFNSILSGVFGPPAGSQCTIPSSQTDGAGCNIRFCEDTDGDGDPTTGLWGSFSPIPGGCTNSLTLVSFSPTDGAPICELVQARFSANVNPSTVDQSDITVECLQAQGGGACATQFPTGSLANNPPGSPLLEWIPDAEFEPGATYQVTFNGFSGQGGEQLPLALPTRQRSFTIGTVGDPTPPTVLSFAPQGTNVCTLAPVQAIFSETMRASTLYDQNNLSVSEAAFGTPYSGTFSHVVSSSGGVPFNTLSAGPSENYLDFTEYQPTLIAGDINDDSTGLQDACRNHLDGNANTASDGSTTDDFSWTYTTSDDAECTPEITSISPDPGYYDGGPITVAGNDFTIAGELIFNNTVYTANNCFDVNNLPNAACIDLGNWTSNQITLNSLPAGEGISNGAISGDVKIFLPLQVSESYTYNVASPHTDTIGSSHLVDGTPAGGVGQFITLSGSQYGTASGLVQFSSLDGTQTWNADLPCSAGWSANEIIAAVPSGVPQNDLTDSDPTNDYYVVRVIDSVGNYSNVTPFIVDDIASSVGLCGITPASGQVGDTVQLDGRGFGSYDSASDAILFGGVSAFVNASSWNNPVDTVSGRVPNIEPATIGVQVQKGGDTSNAVSFTVLPEDPPIIYSVTPDNGAPGTYVTITGANFGDNQGSSTLNIAGALAQFNFPLECLAQGTTWSDSQIIAIVNTTLTPGASGAVEITTIGGTDQSDTPFIVNNTQRPNLCRLIPDNGPAGTLVRALGDNLPQSSPPGVVTYFDSRDSGLFSYTTTAAGTDQVDSTVPSLAQTGPVVVTSGTTNSNSLPFTVGSCAAGTNSCDVASEQCCTSGPFTNSCMPIGQCFGQASESAYGWTFTTGNQPVSTQVPSPAVVELCNRSDACEVGSVSSPSPLDSRDGPVPVNSIVSVRFNQPINLSTLTYGAANNIKIYQCNGNASSDAFDPAQCVSVVTDGTFGQVVDWGIDGQDGFTFTPTLGIDFAPNTWFQVVLEAGSILNEVAGTSPLPLLGNQTPDDGTYRFEFRTRDSLAYADAGCLFLDPAQAIVDVGEVRDYYTELSSEDNSCVTINGSSHQCLWQAEDPGSPPVPSLRANIINPGGPGFTASCDQGLADAQAIGISDTGQIPVDINATVLTQDPLITGGAELFVNGPPYVEEWFPELTGICRNAAVDFTFNERVARHSVRLGGEPSVCVGGELDGFLGCSLAADCEGSDPAATSDDGACLQGATLVMNECAGVTCTSSDFNPAANLLAEIVVRNINGKTNIFSSAYNTPDPLTLDANRSYMITIVGGDQGIHDVSGLAMDQSFHPSVPAANPPNHEWQFSTAEEFCGCDVVQVDISEQDINTGAAQEVTFENQSDDFFTCVGEGCGDDRYDGNVPVGAPDPNVPGNQHLYTARCFDVTYNTEIQPISVLAQYAWSESNPDNNFTADPQGILFGPSPPPLPINQNVIRSEINNGRGYIIAEGAVTAQAGVNLSCFGGFNSGATCTTDADCQNGSDDGVCLPIEDRASKTVQITTFLCNNPWPPLQNTCQAGQCAVGGAACSVDNDCVSLPYEDTANNCTAGGSTCIDTNYSLLYCRDLGVDGFSGDLPALSLDPLVIGANPEPLKDILFTFAPNDCVTLNGENVCLQTGEACDPSPSATTNLCAPITPPDALGIRVLSNPDHLSPRTWYFGGSCGDGSYCTEDSDCVTGGSGSFVNPSGATFPTVLNLSFDEGVGNTTNDASPQNNTGTLLNANWTSGISGSAVSFTGASGSYVNIPSDTSLEFSPSDGFTIDFWFNTQESDGNGFVYKWNGTSEPWWGVRYAEDSGPDIIRLVLNDAAGSSCISDISGAGYRDGSWHHVVGVYNGQVSIPYCQLYVDGFSGPKSNVAGVSTNLSSLGNGANVNIGGQFGNFSGLSGWMDEVRIYDVALTDLQVSNLFGNICNQNVPNPGSPGGTTIDDYQALVDGRTTYVAGSNIDVNQLFTNIYLMSYSAGASAQTQAIYNQLLSNDDGLSRFELNTNFVDYSPNVRFCSAEPTVACTSDLDCKAAGAGDFCDSLKDKVVRDVDRFGDIQDIRLNLQDYEQRTGSFPPLNSGSYIATRSFSTWPSWGETLGSTLSTQLPIDPINDFYLCNLPECSDGIDNDGDGLIDLGDTGCNGDGSAFSENPECNDGIDNDGDGLIDFDPDPQIGDPECLSLTDNNERTTQPACFDGQDNDGDGLTDFPADPGCGNISDNNEIDQPFHEVTCWDEVALDFSCPVDSYVYGYEAVNGGESANVFTEFEVADSFTFTGLNLPPAQVGDACFNFRAANLNDPDGDGIEDNIDNCPASACTNPLDCFNPSQADTDNDLIGDACDACYKDLDNDGDGDGYCQVSTFGLPADNCISIFNPSQQDTDNDGLGDACDFDCRNDIDGDGACDEVDNCPTVFNPNQYNSDGSNTAQYPVNPQYAGAYAAAGSRNTDVLAGEVWPNGTSFGDVCDTNTDQDDDGYADVLTIATTATPDNCSYYISPSIPVNTFCIPGQHNEALPPNYAGTPYGQYAGCYNPDQIDFDNDSFGYACDVQVCGNNLIEATSRFAEGCDFGDGINFPCTGPNGLCNGILPDGCYDIGGGQVSCAYCTVTCEPAFIAGCGNNQIDPGEQCDDGNSVNGDGCSDACQVEISGLCGNGSIDLGEQCDDNNTLDGDGCSSICRREPGLPVCGDGNLDPGEECDNGSQCTGGIACCTLDSSTFPCELCDVGGGGSSGPVDCTLDPNICSAGPGDCQPRNGDGCSDACLLEEPGCASCVLDNNPNDSGLLAECNSGPIVLGNTLDMVIKYHWGVGALAPTNQPNSISVISSPVVADFDKDGVSEIVFAAHNRNEGSLNATSYLRMIDGATGQEKSFFNATDSTAKRVSQESTPAIGDVNNDGELEIVAALASTGWPLAVFDRFGNILAQVVFSGSLRDVHPSITNLDGFGRPEIIVGSIVLRLNGNPGSYSLDVVQPVEINSGTNVSEGGPAGLSATTAADMNGDGFLDVVTGTNIYFNNGTTCNTGVSGFPAVANFIDDTIDDGIDQPEMVVIRNSANQARLNIYDRSCALISTLAIPGTGALDQAGPPTVADFDADGLPEVGVAGASLYTVWNISPTNGSATELWRANIVDSSSSVTGSSVFDFNNDGAFEVLYADHTTFYVFDGLTGAILNGGGTGLPHSSRTRTEYPLVVDVDGDLEAEVIVPEEGNYNTRCNAAGIDCRGIIVYEPPAGLSWNPTRPIWNQHTYHITNVNDDGTIPVAEQSNPDTFNNFRVNQLAISDTSLSDIIPRITDVTESSGVVTIDVRVTNIGEADVITPFDVQFIDNNSGGAVIDSTTINSLPVGVTSPPVQIVTLSGTPVIDSGGNLDISAQVVPTNINQCDDTNDIDSYFCGGCTAGSGTPPPPSSSCTDTDGDGYGSPGDASCSAGAATDCNDNDPNINPGNGTCDLVAAFEFDEGSGTTANDTAPTGVSNDTGTIGPGSSFAWGSLRLGGDAGTYMSIPVSSSQDLELGQQATLAAWVSGVDDGLNAILSSQGSSALDYSYIFGIGPTGAACGGARSPFLWLSDGTNASIYCATGTVSNPTLSNFQWDHIAVTWQSGPAGQVQFFINGAPSGVTQGSTANPIISPKDDINISKRIIGAVDDTVNSGVFTDSDGPNSFPYSLSLDNFYVYSSALDVAQISNVMSGSTPTSSGSPICGNDLLELTEQCDDGNTVNGDGCSSACQNEAIAAVCGNAILESPPEECDDGNTVNGDGCSSACQNESTSGPPPGVPSPSASTSLACNWSHSFENCTGGLNDCKDGQVGGQPAGPNWTYKLVKPVQNNPNPSPASISVNQSIVQDGTKSARSYVPFAQAEDGGSTSKAMVARKGFDFRRGDTVVSEVWYYIPSSSTGRVTVMDFEDSTQSGNPGFRLQIEDSPYRVTVNRDKLGPYGVERGDYVYPKDKWFKFTAVVYVAEGSAGNVKVYIDDNLALDSYGPTIVSGITSFDTVQMTLTARVNTPFEMYSDNAHIYSVGPTCGAPVSQGGSSVAVCGDGILGSGEQCDDGNTNNWDGCSSACQNESVNIALNECDNWQTVHPDWMWCDDFEDTSLTLNQKYTDIYYDPPDSTPLAVISTDGANGSNSVKAHYRVGDISPGTLRRGFGRAPFNHNNYQSGPQFDTQDYRQIYWRYYVKHDNPAGFQGWPDKSSRAFITASGDPWGPNAMMGHIWSSGTNSPYLSTDPASGVDSTGNVVTTKWNDINNYNWLGLQIGNDPMLSNQWHCIEGRIKLNDAGQTNGQFQYWLDGVQQTSHTNLDWVNSWSNYGLNGVMLETYWGGGSPVAQDRLFDSFVISQNRIGCVPNVPTGPACGNGTLEPGEQCDDGNTTGGDGCDSSCQIESLAQCGNGIIDSTGGGSGGGCEALSGTCYYAAPGATGTGTEASPGELRAMINAASAGDFVYLRNGTYGAVGSTQYNCLKPKSGVTVKAYPGESPKIIASNSTQNLCENDWVSSIFYIQNASDVTIDGLELQGGFVAGIMVGYNNANTNNITVTNNTIHNVRTDDNGAGVYINRGNNILVENNLIYDVVHTSGQPQAAGVESFGGTGAYYVIGNDIGDVDYGVRDKHGNGSAPSRLIQYNHFIDIRNGASAWINTPNTVIADNIFENSQWAQYLLGEDAGGYCDATNVQVLRNTRIAGSNTINGHYDSCNISGEVQIDNSWQGGPGADPCFVGKDATCRTGGGSGSGTLEQCDDGNTASGDGCSTSCTIESGYSCTGEPSVCSASQVCGNGTQEGTEQCDDGNTVTESCSYGQATCTVCGSSCTNVSSTGPYCGDGNTDSANGEICDDGVLNGQPGQCAVDCGSTVQLCGNGVKQGTEECDGTDGVGVNQGCSGSCTLVNLTYCGDGIKQTPNQVGTGGSLNDGNEQCDDSNGTNGDGCSSSCVIESLAGYSHLKQIIVDSSKVPSDQQNFPVLINLTNADLRTVANGGQVTNSNGYDIVFATKNNILLNHEIESYDPATGKIVMWVRVPALSSNADTELRMFYGNSAITASQENATLVWDSNYTAVWHMDTSSYSDSTGNVANGTANGSLGPGVGINGAYVFNGGYIDYGVTSQMQGLAQMTFEAWVNLDTIVGFDPIVSQHNGFFDLGGPGSVFWYGIDNGQPRLGLANSAGFAKSSLVLTPGIASHLVATFNNGTVSFYLNGQLWDTVNSSDLASGVYNGSLRVAAQQNVTTNRFGGGMDEIRMSQTVRSADWIETEYNNQSSPSTFYSVVSVN